MKRYLILAEGHSGDAHFGKTARGVLHYGQPMPARDVQDRVHIARVAVQVNGQDGLDRGIGRRRSLDERRVDVQRVGLDVDHDR